MIYDTYFHVLRLNSKFFYYFCGHKNGRVFEEFLEKNLLAAGVFGDSLGSFGDGVLGQFSWEQKTDSSLDFPRGDGVFSVVLGKTLGLVGNTLENVIDKRVHDGHGFGTDSNIGVDLLEDIVDVDSVGFLSLLLAFLVGTTDFAALAGSLLALLGYFLSSFCCVRHVDSCDV